MSHGEQHANLLRRILTAAKTACDKAVLHHVIERYHAYHAESALAVQKRTNAAPAMTTDYYDLVTDFYEFGWGDCFHFAPRFEDERFLESLKRHEYYVALHCRMHRQSTVLDVGCGVAGPACHLANFTGAKIIGININDHQLAKARLYTRRKNLHHLVSYEKVEYHNITFPERLFDAAYAIEVTVHVADKGRVFEKIFKVLKPGGTFAAYEWCLTARFDQHNLEHQRRKKMLEAGNALSNLWGCDYILNAMQQAGFVDIQAKDLDANPRFHNSLVSSPASTQRSPASFDLAEPDR